MKDPRVTKIASRFALLVLISSSVAFGQMGKKWPAEKKVVPDPVTGVSLTFLTSTENGSNRKMYQTHRQWTADGEWSIFRGSRGDSGSQVFAVNEATGDIVQLTATGFSGDICLGNKTMKLFFVPGLNLASNGAVLPAAPEPESADGQGQGGRRRRPSGPRQIVELDLAKLFADVAANKIKAPENYQRICGTVPEDLQFGGNMGVDANDDFAYFRVGGPDTEKLSEGQKMEAAFGPRFGARTSGLRSMNLKTGEIGFICNVGFGMGHVQTNPWNPGEIVFCWETGGKAPQRTWTVMADGTGLRPLYPEAPYEWITHEVVIGKDEVAFNIIGHRGIEQATPDSDWGIAGTYAHPTGVAVVNLRTREMRLMGQVPEWADGRSDWHSGGSADGRWLAFDDFQYQLWLVDRHNGETILLAGPQKRGADHVHPTFSADSTKIHIQSALISNDDRSLNICIVPIPQKLLDRKYPVKLVP